ncbi:chromosomal replication initiator DnaA [Paracoccus sp. IB05]|nr:chromosomal replication initiator DnaA [Paracoccus sp. IB05]
MITEGDKASLRMERATVREIARQVAKEAGVKPAVIFGPGRKQKDFSLRALVCYIARRHGMSYPRIGMALGRDHSTIRSAVINEQRRRGGA